MIKNNKVFAINRTVFRKITKNGTEGKYRLIEKMRYPMSEQKKTKALATLRYAAREFGKTAVNSQLYHKVPKEQQVSIDLDNKLFFDHTRNEIFRIPSSKAYYYEVGTKDKKSYTLGSGTEVLAKRFSPEEQEKNTKIIKQDEKGEYRVFNQDGTLCDTSNKSSKWKTGEVAYGITLDGKLVMHEHIVPYSSNKQIDYGYYHSSLLGGKPGQCFGMMKVKNGQIVKIDTDSGHYKPTQENLYNAVKILQNVIDDNTEITSKGFLYDEGKGRSSSPIYKENKRQFLQRMEAKGADGLTIPERYFKALRTHNEAYYNKLTQLHSGKILHERKDSNREDNQRTI